MKPTPNPDMEKKRYSTSDVNIFRQGAFKEGYKQGQLSQKEKDLKIIEKLENDNERVWEELHEEWTASYFARVLKAQIKGVHSSPNTPVSQALGEECEVLRVAEKEVPSRIGESRMTEANSLRGKGEKK